MKALTTLVILASLPATATIAKESSSRPSMQAGIPTTTAAQTAAASQPSGDFSTPRGALRAYDRALPAGGLSAALSAYHATNDKERKAAEAMAKADLAGARLQKLATERFGENAALDVIHAMRQTTPADLNAADVKVDKNAAIIEWQDDREPLKMIKVDGRWKVSVADLLGEGDDAVDDLIDTNEAIAREFDRTTKELKDGQFANAYLLERAIRQRMFRVLGEDD